MGTDEHGPAYPEPYRCPICHGNSGRYLTCEYPGCPDGRDRGVRVFLRSGKAEREKPPGHPGFWEPGASFMIWGAVAIAIMLWALWPNSHF